MSKFRRLFSGFCDGFIDLLIAVAAASVFTGIWYLMFIR